VKQLRSIILALAVVVSAVLIVPVANPAQAAQLIRAADPSVIRVNSTYYSVQSVNDDDLVVRAASSVDGLASANAVTIWTNPSGLPEVWAPEIVYDGGRFYIYFAAGRGSAHRMYVISSSTPQSGYGSATQMALPDNKWAIDGIPFWFDNQRWFVWSGWAGDTNVEQNLYIARMNSATTTTGPRYIISQPREWWERVVGNPYINEGPQPIKDPNGQLHIAYSANGSWSPDYCVADLRLRSGGDPTNVRDWWKSNGCQYGSNRSTMMSGWDPTLNVNGPGHHSFVLLNGDINTSPPAGSAFPLVYHAVPKSMSYSWANRHWFSGSFMWWGTSKYTRADGSSNTGYGIKYFE